MKGIQYMPVNDAEDLLFIVCDWWHVDIIEVWTSSNKHNKYNNDDV